MVEQQAPVQEAVAPRPGADVFISYSRRDRGAVERLAQALESRGRTAWVDWADIPPTAEWMTEIATAIDASDTFVAVLSPDSVASPVCGQELEAAASANKRIVPVVVREVGAANVPPELAKRNWLFLRNTDDFEAGVDQLLGALDTDLEATRFHTSLLVKAREWERAGEPKSRLLRSSDLSQAESYFASPGKGPSATQEQTRFVLASRRAATRKQRGVIAITTVVALVAATLGALAWNQRSAAIGERIRADRQRARAERQAAIANSRGLAVQATSSLDNDLALGALLSIEAQRVAPTDVSEHAVHVASQTAIWTERTLHAGAGTISSIAFSPDGTTLVTGGADGNVLLWSLETGTQFLSSNAGSDAVTAVAFSPDGTKVATGSERGVVAVWDPSTEDPIALSDQGTHVQAIAFSPDGRSMAAGLSDGGLSIWDVDTQRLRRHAEELHVGRIEAIAFNAGGTLLRVGGKRGSLVTLDIRSGSIMRKTPLGTGSVLSMAFNSDHSSVALGTLGGSVLLRDTATGKPLAKPMRAGDAVTSVVFSPDDTALASGTRDASVQMWDARSGAPFGGRLPGQGGQVEDLAFDPDGQLLASAGGTGTGSVALWTSPGFRTVATEIVDVAFAPDDSIVAVADGQLKVFDRATGSMVVGSLRGNAARTWRIAFSPDGQLLATGNSDGSVTMWDPSTADRIRDPMRDDLRGLVDIAFSPDGRLLAGGSNARSIVLWETASGEPVGEPLSGHSGPIYDVDFSPDGSMLATGSPDGTVRLWNVAKHSPLGSPFRLHGTDNEAWEVAFSPDGTLLASGNADGTVSVWDVDDGEPVGQPLRGHTAAIPSLEFSADGRTLASGSLDGTVILWDVQTWQQIGESLPAFGNAWGLAFSPDGTGLASAGAGAVYIRGATAWTSDAKALEDRLCQVAGRNLTRAEWETHVGSTEYRITCPEYPAGG